MKKTLNEVEWSAGSGFESEKKEKEIIRNEKLKKELRNEFKQKTRFSFWFFFHLFNWESV